MSEAQLRVLSVYELTQGLKQTVEEFTSGCHVEGEVGRLQRPTSGHVYFSMKDDRRDAMIDCVMYKRDAMRFGARLIEGQRVQLRGRATFYPPRGRLQFVADVAKPAGQGALLEALLRLKEKLIAEGLTDAGRKRPLPQFPRRVGVVTSRTGAAFADIRSVAFRRGGVGLLLAPCVVQGDGAVVSIVRALDQIEAAGVDVVILGRGGGSAEDLMAFNDEQVVRRVASMRVPVVSAVGHEIDIALTDLVADARAATPSAAAEMVVPDVLAHVQHLGNLRTRLVRTMRSQLTNYNFRVHQRRTKLGDPRFALLQSQQALDEQRSELRRLVLMRVTMEKSILERQRRGLLLLHPRNVIGRGRAELAPMRTTLAATMRSAILQRAGTLRELGVALDALSPLSVLGRGFALVSSPERRVLRDASELNVGDDVTVLLQKGRFLANVQKVVPAVENPSTFDHEKQRSGDLR